MVWLHSAQAQEMPPSARQQTSTSQPFTIPASDLGTALLRAGAIAEVRIVFDPRRLAGIETTGLAGRFTLDEALSRLLHGTGLRHRMDEQGSVRLEEASPAAGLKQPAVASEDVPQSLLAAALDEVVVVAPAELDRPAKDDAYRVARSTSVMTRDDIERSRGTSVGDIFKGATGVLVGENRNSGGLDINIRGMQGQGRVPILVDGARQETTVYRGYSGVASRSYIDPDLIGGIQIDKGPVMSAEGTGATGGLVSMRTINADDIVQPGKDFGLRLRGQAIGNNSGASVAPGTSAGLFMGRPGDSGHVYRTDCVTPSICTPALPNEWGHPEGRNRPGTFDFKNWAGSVAAAKRLEAIDLVAAYAQRRQGNYYAGKHGPTAWMDVSDTRKLPFYTEVRPAIQGATLFEGGERIPGSNFQSKSGMLKAKAFLPADQELELSYLRYSSAYAELMPSQILRFSGLNPVSQPYDSDVTVDTYTSRYRWNPSENPLIDLRANLWHTRSNASNNNPFGEDLDIDGGVRQEYRRTGLDVTNTSTLHHQKGWGESQARYGVALQYEDVRPVMTEHSVQDTRAGSDGDRHEYSAFAAWQYKPTSTITLDAGLRHTRFRSRDNRTIPATNQPNHNQKSGTTPVVSLAWEPRSNGLQLYGRYAEAQRMPSLFESTSSFSFLSKPDINLQPEHAKNKELGINFLKDGLLHGSDKLRLKFAWFHNHTSNYLTRTAANLWEEGMEEGKSWDYTMRNIDSATFGGLELSGSYDMGAIFTEFGVTKYNRIEICHTGSYRIHQCNNYGIANSYINNMVPPNWHGNLTLGTRLLERKLVLGVRGIFMGQRNNTPQYNDDTDHGFLKVVPWHAYRTFDFFASYKVSDRVSIDFNLDNFTDRYYLDALSLGLIPAPGRTARLGVTLQF